MAILVQVKSPQTHRTHLQIFTLPPTPGVRLSGGLGRYAGFHPAVSLNFVILSPSSCFARGLCWGVAVGSWTSRIVSEQKSVSCNTMPPLARPGIGNKEVDVISCSSESNNLPIRWGKVCQLRIPLVKWPWSWNCNGSNMVFLCLTGRSVVPSPISPFSIHKREDFISATEHRVDDRANMIGPPAAPHLALQILQLCSGRTPTDPSPFCSSPPNFRRGTTSPGSHSCRATRMADLHAPCKKFGGDLNRGPRSKLRRTALVTNI